MLRLDDRSPRSPEWPCTGQSLCRGRWHQSFTGWWPSWRPGPDCTTSRRCTTCPAPRPSPSAWTWRGRGAGRHRRAAAPAETPGGGRRAGARDGPSTRRRRRRDDPVRRDRSALPGPGRGLLGPAPRARSPSSWPSAATRVCCCFGGRAGGVADRDHPRCSWPCPGPGSSMPTSPPRASPVTPRGWPVPWRCWSARPAALGAPARGTRPAARPAAAAHPSVDAGAGPGGCASSNATTVSGGTSSTGRCPRGATRSSSTCRGCAGRVSGGDHWPASWWRWWPSAGSGRRAW